MGDWKYVKRNLKNESFDDSDIKRMIQEISLEILGFETKINERDNGKGIDLVSADDPLLGVEVERGGWVGDFWDDEYSWKSKQPFQTVNMPDRKEKYWLYEYNMFSKTHTNSSWRRNVFVRSNFFRTQIIVVDPHIIIDPEKTIRTQFVARNNGVMEDWLSWKREDVKTYNLIDGKYILETEENGKFPPMTAEEKSELIKLMKKIKKEIKQRGIKRAAEVYKASKSKV